MVEIQNLTKKIDFDSSLYYFKGKCNPKTLINFEGPLRFYKNIRDGHTTLGKAEEGQKKFKSHVNEIIKWRHKSEEKNANRKY